MGVGLRRSGRLCGRYQQQRAVWDEVRHVAARGLQVRHQLCALRRAEAGAVRQQVLLGAAQRAPRLAVRVVLPLLLLLLL